MHPPAELYLGLISGTSADAIDAVLARFEPGIEIVAAAAVPYCAELRRRVLDLARREARADLDELGSLDTELGRAFAAAALDLLQRAGVDRDEVCALGSHGQTVRHGPAGPAPFTLQLGDPNVIAERTGITTVADFRRRDLAAGGQGAPLLPALHAALFSAASSARVVLNLGGIANITVLPAQGSGRDAPVRGFDTGPANCLLDAWAARHLGRAHDPAGAWAAAGQVDAPLLAALLQEPYFAQRPPKSTGRELFNLDWLDGHLAARALAPADVQATLVALSARSVADAVAANAPEARQVYACGGGVHNPVLMAALQQALAPRTLLTTAALGVDPDFVEAAAFAWLARRRLRGEPGNLPAVTGASGPRVLGAVYFGALSST